MYSAEGISAPSDPLIGQVVQERYKIAHAIGRGAMGVVYEAQHLLIGRKVALKTMAAHSVSAAGVQRFRREAQAAAAVGSSHVVDVLDMGRLDNGCFYIVMEHLAGVDLGFAVALDQRFSVARAVHVLEQLCDALSAIHAAGIVHRDLKPENIFLTTRDGRADFVKVLDFGVCKFNGAEGGRLTATGDTIGTPLFMAPEQVDGRECDCRTDIYALGALLYFALTGRAPFDAPNLSSLFLRICHDPAPSLASADNALSFELDAIIQRALSKDPNARFASCAAFKAALRAVRATSDEVAATLPGALPDSRAAHFVWGAVASNGTASRVRRQPLRRPRWFGVGAFGVAALAVSASSGAYLVRARGVESAPVRASVPVLPSNVEVLPPPPAVVEGAPLVTELPQPKAAAPRPVLAGGATPRRDPASPRVEPVPPPRVEPAPAPVPQGSEPSVATTTAQPAGPAPSASDLHFTKAVKRGL